MFIKLKYLVFVFVLSAFTCFSQELVQNDTETAITFKIKNFGLNVDGSFSDFTILSNFNSSNLKESFLNAEIDVKSISTGSKSMEEHLFKSDFFDVEKHPKIVFKSSEIIKRTNDRYLIKGSLFIKGIEKKMEVPLEVKETETNVAISANFVLNRRDFGVGGSSFVLSKKVNVKMIYVATKN
jgi:polyisoprenoid-binding protein YceI